MIHMIHKGYDLLKHFLARITRNIESVPLASLLGTVLIAIISYSFITPVKQEGLTNLSLFPEVFVDSDLALMKDAAYLNSPDGVGEFGIAEELTAAAPIEKGSFTNVNPSTSARALQSNILVHKVAKGETLSNIAKSFGISINTILWANNLKNSYIYPGQELIILPVSGALHEVKQGETVESIAELYGTIAERIASANNKKIVEGDIIVIPNGRPLKKAVIKAQASVAGYLKMPIKDGLNWGKLHGNAIDISTQCGTEIHASAEGLVEAVGAPKEFNDGLGGFVKVAHPLGIETVYAYTEENLVSVGDYINQGDTIAKVGNSGKSTNPSGCHLEFGVIGAANPFVK